MELFEVVAIQREDRTTLTGGKGENFVIRDFLSGLPGGLHGQDIMSKGAEKFNDGEWILFVGVESSHSYAASLI